MPDRDFTIGEPRRASLPGPARAVPPEAQTIRRALDLAKNLPLGVPDAHLDGLRELDALVSPCARSSPAHRALDVLLSRIPDHGNSYVQRAREMGFHELADEMMGGKQSSEAPPSGSANSEAVEWAEQTLDGTLPYEETWRTNAENVLALTAELAQARQAYEQERADLQHVVRERQAAEALLAQARARNESLQAEAGTDRLWAVASEVARLVCVRDVAYLDDRAGMRALDLAANELGHLLGLPEPEFANVWRGDDTLGRRSPSLPPATKPERRAGAAQVMRASIERCRREGKHLEWVDVDDLATVLDDLREAVAERDALRSALEEICGTKSALGALTPTEAEMRALARAVLGGEAAPPGEGQDLGASEARNSEGSAA